MNDPRITAYALGELTGSEREQFERELAASETLQRELNETIKLADMLGKLPMPTETLTPEKRNALREQCTKNLKIARPASFSFRRIVLIGGITTAAAACLLLTLVIFPKEAPQKTAVKLAAAPAASKNFPASESPVQMTIAEAKAPKLLEEGKDFLRSGRYDLAVKRFGQVLADNKENIDARKGLERVNEARQQYTAQAYNETRSKQLLLVDKGWNLPVRVFQAGATTITEFPAATVSTEPMPAAPASQTLTATKEAKIKTFTSDLAAASAVTVRSGQTTTVQVVREFRYPSETEEKLWNPQLAEYDTESYDAIQENVFLTAKDNPLSTFSIDVDTASYANVRRFLQSDQLPPAGAIRTEELINYFSYAYPQPEGDAPFSVNLEVSRAPWDAKRELVRIGLKGREIPVSERGPANLVFLIDVSGSMDSPDKLPLLKRSLQSLVENLSPRDRVAIVVYAGSSGLVLPSTPGTEKSRILEALENLQAGGSTNGASGIRLAYDIARENFLKEGNNRVILCTDGDFNVGTTSQSELVSLIEKERASGVFLSVLGFGTGNLKDSTMEKLADKGNGNYAYIDSLTEGRKVLVEQMGATLFTIAKDVKIQVEFNPARVAGYRLIGYENRLLAKEDFNDDKKDAGEIGAGHAVTALYEIIPAGQPLPDQPSVDPLKYQKSEPVAEERPVSTELLTVKLRYKAPDGDTSKLLEVPLTAPEIPAFEQASPDFRFAAAVAAFGMKLRGSPAAGNIGWNDIQKIVRETLGDDPGSYRAEFLTLIEKAARLKPSGRTPEE